MEIAWSTLITGNNFKICKYGWCKSHVVFLPIYIQQVFFACCFVIRGWALLATENTENLTFQAVIIMYCWISTPHFVRVGSLREPVFVTHITKSVKQSVQISVVSEFAICFSELDLIFGQIVTGVVFWSVGWECDCHWGGCGRLFEHLQVSNKMTSIVYRPHTWWSGDILRASSQLFTWQWNQWVTAKTCNR